MATFLVAHGAWSAGWGWKKMHPLLQARGYTLVTPTHTGLGERGHLVNANIDLETHIADQLGVLEFEDLTGVILIGHSYGGMVATGVADRARARIAQLVYLDAFAPKDGESVFSLAPGRAEAMRAAAGKNGGLMPPSPMPPDTPEADRTWAEPRRLPQPLKTFEQALRFKHGELTLPRHFIYCKRHNPGDPFRQFLERARRENWGAIEIDSSHNPHITCPDLLAGLLEQIAQGRRLHRTGRAEKPRIECCAAANGFPARYCEVMPILGRRDGGRTLAAQTGLRAGSRRRPAKRR